MKIEGHSPSPELGQAERDRARSTTAESRARPEGSEPDKVALSSHAQILDTALRAAAAAPEVRQELVERMREAVAEGRVGTDLQRLADRIIDQMLKQP